MSIFAPICKAEETLYRGLPSRSFAPILNLMVFLMILKKSERALERF